MENFISSKLTNEQQVEIYPEEKEYITKHNLISGDVTFIEKDPTTRFQDAYIERCDKETEEILSKESFTFLEQPIDYLQKHKNEFIYIESDWFELIGVDGISFEVNDLFGTYDVLLGLQLKKKYEGSLKEYLHNQLHGDQARFELMFNQNDGVWDFNFALDYMDEFNEEMSIENACRLVYQFLFKLVERMEESIKEGN